MNNVIAIYVRGRTPLEQLGVKCLAQGHIGVSQWIRTWVSHTKGMCVREILKMIFLKLQFYQGIRFFFF